MTTVGNHSRRQAAVEQTVARLNAECEAAGLGADYRVKHDADGVPYVALASIVRRERLGGAKPAKRERL